jgi:hypothetical protein
MSIASRSRPETRPHDLRRLASVVCVNEPWKPSRHGQYLPCVFLGEKNLIDDFGHNAWKWGAINWDIDSSQWFWEQSLHIPTPDDTLQLQRLTIGEICGLISRSYTYGEPRTVLPELALGIHIQSDIETGQCRLLEQLFIR